MVDFGVSSFGGSRKLGRWSVVDFILPENFMVF